MDSILGDVIACKPRYLDLYVYESERDKNELLETCNGLKAKLLGPICRLGYILFHVLKIYLSFNLFYYIRVIRKSLDKTPNLGILEAD